MAIQTGGADLSIYKNMKGFNDYAKESRAEGLASALAAAQIANSLAARDSATTELGFKTRADSRADQELQLKKQKLAFDSWNAQPHLQDETAPSFDMTSLSAPNTSTVTPDNPIIQSMIKAESGGNPTAVSPVGAQGLMQLMPDTAKELGVTDPFNPDQNIAGGTKYYNQLLGKYAGDHGKALMAYNWGMGNVDKWMANGSNPNQIPAETRNYVQKVTQGAGIAPTEQLKPLYMGGVPFTKGAPKGYQWARDAQGQTRAMPITGGDIDMAKSSASDVTDRALDTVNRLLANASGVRANRGGLSTLFPNISDSSVNAEADFETLKALLTTDNIKILKGTGSFSDGDIRLLQNISTGQLNGADKQVMGELRKLQTTLSGKAGVSLASPAPTNQTNDGWGIVQ